MKRGLLLKSGLVAGAFGLVATSIGHILPGNAQEASWISQFTDDKGQIQIPDFDYRRDWTVLGAWSVDSDEGVAGSRGIHLVYSQRETVDHYRKTGKFPDGAILLKELLSTNTEDMTTGTVSRASQVDGWFVMIKGEKWRHQENPLWGEGWGWAYFDASDRKTPRAPTSGPIVWGVTFPRRIATGFM